VARFLLVPGDAMEPDEAEAFAVADEHLPLFWLSLFSAEEATPGVTGQMLVARTPDAIRRSRERLQLLTPPSAAFNDSADVWLSFLNDLTVETLALRLESAAPSGSRGLQGQPDLARALHGWPDVTATGYRRLLRTAGWPHGLPTNTSPEEADDLTRRLCGTPGFRPVPWRAPEDPGSIAAQGSLPPSGAGPRHLPRQPPGNSGREANDERPSGRPLFTPAWVVSGLLVVVLLAAWTAATPPLRGRLGPMADVTAIVLLAVGAAAAIVRARWPLAAVVVVGMAMLAHAALGYTDGPLLIALPLGLSTICYRSPLWKIALGAPIVLTTLWLIDSFDGGTASPLSAWAEVVAFSIAVGAIPRGIKRFLDPQGSSGSATAILVRPE
jgi:hypothetical protein